MKKSLSVVILLLTLFSCTFSTSSSMLSSNNDIFSLEVSQTKTFSSYSYSYLAMGKTYTETVKANKNQFFLFYSFTIKNISGQTQSFFSNYYLNNVVDDGATGSGEEVLVPNRNFGLSSHPSSLADRETFKSYECISIYTDFKKCVVTLEMIGVKNWTPIRVTIENENLESIDLPDIDDIFPKSSAASSSNA
jgi:hypothetical protein